MFANENLFMLSIGCPRQDGVWIYRQCTPTAPLSHWQNLYQWNNNIDSSSAVSMMRIIICFLIFSPQLLRSGEAVCLVSECLKSIFFQFCYYNNNLCKIDEKCMYCYDQVFNLVKFRKIMGNVLFSYFSLPWVFKDLVPCGSNFAFM